VRTESRGLGEHAPPHHRARRQADRGRPDRRAAHLAPSAGHRICHSVPGGRSGRPRRRPSDPSSSERSTALSAPTNRDPVRQSGQQLLGDGHHRDGAGWLCVCRQTLVVCQGSIARCADLALSGFARSERHRRQLPSRSLPWGRSRRMMADSPLGRVCTAVQIRRSNERWPCGPSEPMKLLDAAAGIAGSCQAVPSGGTGDHVARQHTHCKHALDEMHSRPRSSALDKSRVRDSAMSG